MMMRLAKKNGQAAGAACSGFTLVEILIAFVIFTGVTSGILYGYVQTNRMAEWSCMSLSAQSYAAQGAEQARAADWRPRDYPVTNGYGTMDELPPVAYVNCGSNYVMDIPIRGNPSSTDFPFFVTNYVTVSTITLNPPLRQIRSDAVWTFYLTGRIYTNTVILQRAPDQ